MTVGPLAAPRKFPLAKIADNTVCMTRHAHGKEPRRTPRPDRDAWIDVIYQEDAPELEGGSAAGQGREQHVDSLVGMIHG